MTKEKPLQYQRSSTNLLGFVRPALLSIRLHL